MYPKDMIYPSFVLQSFWPRGDFLCPENASLLLKILWTLLKHGITTLLFIIVYFFPYLVCWWLKMTSLQNIAFNFLLYYIITNYWIHSCFVSISTGFVFLFGTVWSQLSSMWVYAIFSQIYFLFCFPHTEVHKLRSIWPTNNTFEFKMII